MKFLKYSFALLLLSPIAAQASSPLEGFWITQNERAVIHIEECDASLCGYVHWIIEGGMQYDEKNADEAKRTTPMCGLPIIWGFEKKSDTEWENGRIYKADDGDIYDAEMELNDDGTLRVRGYMGISLLGKSQTWKRVDETDYPVCIPPK